MRQQYGKIQHAGGEVIVVSFEDAQGVHKLINAHKLPFVFLLDPKKEVYCLYGMIYREKGAVVTYRTMLDYLKLRWAGYPKQQRGKNIRQMGGDVIIDKEGLIRLIYQSQFPEDRPNVGEMITILTS